MRKDVAECAALFGPTLLAAPPFRARRRAGGGCGRVASLQLPVCGAGAEEPAGRKDPDPGARHFAVGAGPRFFVDRRDRVYRAVPGAAARRRMRRDLRDLYLASLEYDVQPI